MNRSSAGTLVERISRYVKLVELDGKTAADILPGFTRHLKSTFESLSKTMTYDQGSDTTLHESLSAKLRMDAILCAHHNPRQRGSTVNVNGLIRQFLPMGMGLSQVSHQKLSFIKHSPNHRPRRMLGFESAH